MLLNAVLRSAGTYSLSPSDCGMALIFDTTNVSTTINLVANPTYDDLWFGFQCEIYNRGNRDITIPILPGVTITPGSHGHLKYLRATINGSTVCWHVVVGGGGPETDPVFLASPAGSITAQQKTDWDASFSHSQQNHAPVNAQKNSDITKEEIEAKLTGLINSHSHSGLGAETDPIFLSSPAATIEAWYIIRWWAAYEHATNGHAPVDAQKNSDITKEEIEAKLTGNITSHTHPTTRYEPVTNGDVNNPELVFYNGDVVMVEVDN